MLVGGLSNPTQLFFEGGDGKKFCPEDRVIVHQDMMASVINETMDKVAGEMVENMLLRTQERQRVLEEKKGFSGLSVQFVEVNGG